LLVANFSRLSLRKTKTDKKDAMTIAQFILLHSETLMETEQPGLFQDLEDYAREHEALAKIKD